MELVPVQRQGAVLEAAGYSRDAIARVLDVKPATVSGWRKSDAYLVAVDEYGRRAADEIGPIVSRMKAEVVDAAFSAIKMLREAIEATDAEGYPKWGIRVQAANAIHSYLRTIAGAADAQEGGGSASATLIVKIDGQGNVVGQPRPEEVEAEVVEDGD